MRVDLLLTALVLVFAVSAIVGYVIEVRNHSSRTGCLPRKRHD